MVEMQRRLRNLLPTFAATIGIAFVTLSPVATAQGGGDAIDLFEGQESMAAGNVSIETLDGAPVDRQDEWDGSTPVRVDGGLTIRYERGSSGILVPAEIAGHDVFFLFDTGATYTSINTDFARRAGIAPRATNPAIRLQTANGLVEARLGLLSNLRLGGRNHHGVTFVDCRDCPSGVHRGKPIVGLLGMNVIGRYVTSFDHDRGVLEMTVGSRYDDRSRDIEPWLTIDTGKSLRIETVLRFNATIVNRSPRRIRKLDVRVQCRGGEPVNLSRGIPAGGKVTLKETIRSGDCSSGARPEVVGARW